MGWKNNKKEERQINRLRKATYVLMYLLVKEWRSRGGTM